MSILRETKAHSRSSSAQVVEENAQLTRCCGKH
jgi:hypothetical protein